MRENDIKRYQRAVELYLNEISKKLDKQKSKAGKSGIKIAIRRQIRSARNNLENLSSRLETIEILYKIWEGEDET